MRCKRAGNALKNKNLALHKLLTNCKVKSGNYSSEKSDTLFWFKTGGYNKCRTKTAKTETKTKRFLEKILMFEERRKEENINSRFHLCHSFMVGR